MRRPSSLVLAQDLSDLPLDLRGRLRRGRRVEGRRPEIDDRRRRSEVRQPHLPPALSPGMKIGQAHPPGLPPQRNRPIQRHPRGRRDEVRQPEPPDLTSRRKICQAHLATTRPRRRPRSVHCDPRGRGDEVGHPEGETTSAALLRLGLRPLHRDRSYRILATLGCRQAGHPSTSGEWPLEIRARERATQEHATR